MNTYCIWNFRCSVFENKIFLRCYREGDGEEDGDGEVGGDREGYGERDGGGDGEGDG